MERAKKGLSRLNEKVPIRAGRRERSRPVHGDLDGEPRRTKSNQHHGGVKEHSVSQVQAAELLGGSYRQDKGTKFQIWFTGQGKGLGRGGQPGTKPGSRGWSLADRTLPGPADGMGRSVPVLRVVRRVGARIPGIFGAYSRVSRGVLENPPPEGGPQPALGLGESRWGLPRAGAGAPTSGAFFPGPSACRL